MEHREIKSSEQIAELKLRSPGGYRNLREVVINELPDDSLLRTPSVTDATGGAISESQARERGRMEMLPTPTTRDFKDGQAEHIRDGKIQTDTVGRAVMNSGEITKISWGKFEPAIRRWEEITRKAPAPTKPDGKDGAHRLSAEFTEWMMGLPEGWVTAPDLGLKRNDQLKACGNGVVPQQAELALRMLLQGVSVESVPKGGLDEVLPTPTVMDQRDGKHFRAVAVRNLASGKNRGLNLNNVVEAIGVDWVEGDTFTMTEDGLKKDER